MAKHPGSLAYKIIPSVMARHYVRITLEHQFLVFPPIPQGSRNNLDITDAEKEHSEGLIYISHQLQKYP